MTEREPLIEEARQRLEACLQTKLCKPLVHTWTVWGYFLSAFILALCPASYFPAGSLERGLIGFALTLTGLFLWETHLFSQVCRVQRWKEALDSFCHRHRNFKRLLFFIGPPIIFWWPFPPLSQLWRIMGLEYYLFVLYAVQELQKFSLDNPELIRGFQVSLLKPQPKVLRCAKQIVADYSPEARKELAAQIEIQLSALEGLTWPWTIGVGIAVDRSIDLLSDSPLAVFFIILALAILLQLTNRVYNYTALVQAIAQVKYEEQVPSNELKEESPYVQ